MKVVAWSIIYACFILWCILVAKFFTLRSIHKKESKTRLEETKKGIEFDKNNTIVLDNIFLIITCSKQAEDPINYLYQHVFVLKRMLEKAPRTASFYKIKIYQAIDMFVGAIALHYAINPVESIEYSTKKSVVKNTIH